MIIIIELILAIILTVLALLFKLGKIFMIFADFTGGILQVLMILLMLTTTGISGIPWYIYIGLCIGVVVLTIFAEKYYESKRAVSIFAAGGVALIPCIVFMLVNTQMSTVLRYSIIILIYFVFTCINYIWIIKSKENWESPNISNVFSKISSVVFCVLWGIFPGMVVSDFLYFQSHILKSESMAYVWWAIISVILGTIAFFIIKGLVYEEKKKEQKIIDTLATIHQRNIKQQNEIYIMNVARQRQPLEEAKKYSNQLLNSEFNKMTFEDFSKIETIQKRLELCSTAINNNNIYDYEQLDKDINSIRSYYRYYNRGRIEK